MDSIPVDGPPQGSYPSNQSSTGGASSLGGALSFDENLKDIPQEVLAAAQQQQQPPPQDARPQQSSAGSQQTQFGQQTNNLAVYPSVLAPAPTPHHFSPAPGIPPNQPPQSLPPLQPQQVIGPDGTVQQLPVKRPRGRPRKIPGVDSRPPAGGTTAGRGRPKGSRGTRGRGRPRGSGMKARQKRARLSSDDDDEDLISVDDSSEDERKKEKDVDLNEEVDDDFGPEGKVGATTKFGRKISKPKSFVPTNKPTITRKKRQSMAPLEVNLMCQTCHLGHSPPGNALVICDACSKGWHQLCHIPMISAEIIASDLPFYCSSCDVKVSEMKKQVTVLEGEWTDGKGEDKGPISVLDPALTNDLPVPPPTTTEGDMAVNPTAESVDGQTDREPAVPVDPEVEKAKPYSEALKKEWLFSLPTTTLVGYILSVEKKYGNGEDGLAIWPKDLAGLLESEKEARKAAELERERKLEEEAEALAAAAIAAQTIGIDTPGTETNSEAGTPITFEVGENPAGGARTAASKRLQGEREAREAAQATVQTAKDQQQQYQQQQAKSQLGQREPAYKRPAIPMTSALASQNLNGAGGLGDIQVGGGASSSSLQPQQGQQMHSIATAAAAAQQNRYPPYSYANGVNASTSPYGSASTGGTFGFQTGLPVSGAAGTYQPQQTQQPPYANMYAPQSQQPPQQQNYGQPGGGYSLGRN
ncbi:phf1/phf2 family PHD finger domain-containing protein [Sporobolomyces koalae]|uniref:phf1/phf2 family PHD finger domain-containing protein n=1 Tax=Sporobolomyces koalae TaxID=500713 RepID=UPI00318161B2